MVRTFQTHLTRKQEELSGKLWKFTPQQGDYAGQEYTVMVPSCWETYPDFGLYRGKGSYETEFEAGGTVRIVFKGVSHTAEVYLDGEKIGEHYNAYTIFSIIVKDLPEGRHILKVIADNRFSEASALHIPNDYMTYGGIIRPVVLEKLPEIFIKQLHLTPIKTDQGWEADAEIWVENLSCEEKCIRCKLYGEEEQVKAKEDQLCIEPGTAGYMRMRLEAHTAAAWEPENPKLYKIRAVLYEGECERDDLIERIGFRTVKAENQRIWINDREIRIKGICRHEDHPQYGCALPAQAHAYDLNLIRDLGVNSVRTSHYPNDEIFLDFCDEMGILVWEENHARGIWEEGMRNPNFRPQCQQVIHEMISAHYNHPCIYIWGILNECASNTEYGKMCYKEQLEQIKRLDSSRLTSFASCHFKKELCWEYPDVVAYNIYPYWYHDIEAAEFADDLFRWVQKDTEGAGKPFLITEIGAGAVYGNRNPYKSRWSEEYQAEALEKQLTGILGYENCSGLYIWQFCDVRVSEEWFSSRPRTMNNKGIVDEYRRRKMAYDTVKRIFHTYSNIK